MSIPEYIMYLYYNGFDIFVIVDKVYNQIVGIDNPVSRKYVLNLVEKTILEHTTNKRT